MKKIETLLLIIWISFFNLPTLALEGHVKYDSVNIDYSILNPEYFSKEGNDWLYKAEHEKNINKKKEYYGKAAGAYETMMKTNPKNPYPYAKLGHIYGKLGKYSLSKSFFYRSLNFDRLNPYTNYYFGIFYDDDKDYINARTYYNIAFNNGYARHYDLNLALGILYEKLADLNKANYYYKRANSIKSSKTLKNKIRLLDELKYDKSKYYQFR